MASGARGLRRFNGTSCGFPGNARRCNPASVPVSESVSGSDKRMAACVGGLRGRKRPATHSPSSRVPHTNSLTLSRPASRHPRAERALKREVSGQIVTGITDACLLASLGLVFSPVPA
jgi:hypothetical protein